MTSSTSRTRLGRRGLIAALASIAAVLGAPVASVQAAAHPAAGRATLTAAPRGGQVTAAGPPGRQWASFAYDPARHELVLFGGHSGTGVFGDTWTRSNGTWTQQHPASSPSARTGAAMVYDAATRQLLLFGGSALPYSGGGYSAQTWLWTGTTWRRLHPGSSPSPRHNADMIYDAATHNVILFGGYDGGYLGDTWAWNGTTWAQLHPATSPSPRDSEPLAYDGASHTAIMYGGFSSEAGRLSDTWSWDGTTWTQLHPPTSPGIVTYAWMGAYDAASGQVLLFGGDPSGGGPYLNQTWAWTGTTWTQLSPALSPGARGYGSMTYNSDTRRIVLFGGVSDTGGYPASIWDWDGSTWDKA